MEAKTSEVEAELSEEGNRAFNPDILSLDTCIEEKPLDIASGDKLCCDDEVKTRARQ